MTDPAKSSSAPPGLVEKIESNLVGALKNVQSASPCPPDHVRLYRAAVIDSDIYKRKYAKAHEEILHGTFKIDSAEKKALADRLISHKDQIVGGFYSDSLEATLPYFLRHNDDPTAQRVLYYIDVPLKTAQNTYFVNVSSMMIGAVHHESIFKKFIKEAEVVLNKVVTWINPDPGDLVKKQDEILQSAEYITRLHKDSTDFNAFVNAFQTCKYEDIKDEFFLPQNTILRHKKSVVAMNGTEACALTEKQWKKIGKTLDKQFNPDFTKRRMVLTANFTPSEAMERIFKTELPIIAAMVDRPSR